MFIALRDLRYAKGRFALLTGVIAVLTLMVVLLTGLTAGLGAASTSAVAALPVDAVTFQRPAAGQSVDFATSSLPTDTVRTVADRPGVTAAYPLGVATTRLTAGTASAAVTAVGTDPTLYPALKSGGAPGAGEVVVSATLAADDGIRVGDRVTLGGGTVRVAGTVEATTFNHLPTVYATAGTWRTVAHTDRITAVAVRGDVGGAVAGTTTVARDDAFAAVGGYSSEQGSLTLMRVLLLGVSVLVVGAFFTVWTLQRAGDLAVVRAIGAGRGYVLRDALGQALLVLAAGTVVGGAAAVGLGALAAGAVPFVLSAGTVGVPLAAMVVVGLVGAAASVRRVTTVDPLTALGAAR
ncbi:ABC transporter permease [Actinocatenispora rupis]|uniref:ABC transporter permease n=1 Tax=Actinocatenispora rupis TaxID=519421 RepID=A0A8J3NAN5_9ACTN|nr:ABC transporter permease [Actinocatenispora rupis]GID12559.1 ABC transporter permease [Actinocatenispora rupis]